MQDVACPRKRVTGLPTSLIPAMPGRLGGDMAAGEPNGLPRPVPPRLRLPENDPQHPPATKSRYSREENKLALATPTRHSLEAHSSGGTESAHCRRVRIGSFFMHPLHYCAGFVKCSIAPASLLRAAACERAKSTTAPAPNRLGHEPIRGGTAGGADALGGDPDRVRKPRCQR